MNNEAVWLKIQKSYKSSGLSKTFVEVMGWEVPSEVDIRVSAAGQTWRGSRVAILKNYAVIQFDVIELPDALLLKQIDKALSIRNPEKIIVFNTSSSSRWAWPKKTSGGAQTLESIDVQRDALPTFLAQRLSGLVFSVTDIRRGVTIAQVRDRVRGSFDTSEVTNAFYKGFQKQHDELFQNISGLPDEAKYSYATLMLNRLMFIYFLQKKEFLNKDANYLRTCLSKVQALRGQNKFFGFYRDYLQTLFFEVLNKPTPNISDPEIKAIIGEVKYINGGIFGANELEESFTIEIPDEVFESIFDFFDSYTWHLDTRPTGNPNEINPEVIGYIFEQYINFTAGGKKDKGAYYTKHDVTGYMVNQTLVPKILDVMIENGLNPLMLLINDPSRYVSKDMLHGYDFENGQWLSAPQELVSIWESDPLFWSSLDDAKPVPELGLAGESWVELFHRRSRVDGLLEDLANGRIGEVDDLITHGLDGLNLVLDALTEIDDYDDLLNLWGRISNLTVIDPTCGSGAFLFAALEVLEVVYLGIFARLESLRAPENLRSLFGAQGLASESIKAHYLIRKHVALNNLFGTDLMPDAVETAKLRIFLALASCLENVDDLEPLPDLDFNLKTGNLIVGFKDISDVTRVSRGQLLATAEVQALEPAISDFVELHSEFIAATELGSPATSTLKAELRGRQKQIRAEADRIYASCLGIEEDGLKPWIDETRPFHWFAEFPSIIERGGFDVIVGNPPYVKRSETDVSQFQGYDTESSPDLFAVCYERSISLLEPNGRHAFVVMLNFAYSDNFSSIRDVISKTHKTEWWSTYGKRPDSLFTGVQVRNTILILGSTSNKKYSSCHQLFSAQGRGHLFSALDYQAITRDGTEPPARGGVANSLAFVIKNSSVRPTQAVAAAPAMRKTATYWFPVLPTAPKVLSPGLEVADTLDPQAPRLKMFRNEIPELTTALLAGKVGYFWWSCIGDDFNAQPSQTLLPRSLALAITPSNELRRLAQNVVDKGLEIVFASSNAGWLPVNIRWNAARSVTDEFDLAFLTELGLESTWRTLNIWYRQVMKSSGENSNGVQVSPELARLIFDSDHL